MLSRILLPVLAVALGACASIPTSRSTLVTVTDSKAVVEKCTNVGTVDGETAVGRYLLRDTARDSALARLKIQAAELGGTHVLSSIGDIKWKGPDRSGVVYVCKPSR